MIIYHHLGLGDHIVCNGLVRHFAETDDILLICKNKNYNNVQFMYRNNSKITIHKVENDIEAKEFCDSQHSIKVLKIGFAVGAEKHTKCLWDENFYKNANIDFEYSWSKFFVNPDLDRCKKVFKELNPNNESYIFVHSIDSTNTDRIDYSVIDQSKKKILSNPNIAFFDYYYIIQRASEIHCIDSSFKHLVDRIPTAGKLFYHKLANPKEYDCHNSKKEWIIV